MLAYVSQVAIQRLVAVPCHATRGSFGLLLTRQASNDAESGNSGADQGTDQGTDQVGSSPRVEADTLDRQDLAGDSHPQPDSPPEGAQPRTNDHHSTDDDARDASHGGQGGGAEPARKLAAGDQLRVRLRQRTQADQEHAPLDIFELSRYAACLCSQRAVKSSATRARMR